LKGHEPDDLDQLAVVHGTPSNQPDHCLRRPDHDGEEGLAASIAECRGAITNRVMEAVAAVDEFGSPDPSRRMEADVYLDLRGSAEASLPEFHFRLGQALHTLQDGFSHSYRSEDQKTVITLLNYVDLVNDELDEGRDGPPHSSPLDRCLDLDERRQRRLDAVIQASSELLQIAADTSEGTGAQLARLDSFFDEYLAVCSMQNNYCGFGQPCSAENAWCGAPEANYEQPSRCVCSAPGAQRGRFGAAYAGLALAAMLTLRSRRRRGLAAAATAALAFGIARPAAAQDSAPPPTDIVPAQPATTSEPEPAAAPPSVAPMAPAAPSSTAPAVVDGSSTSTYVVDGSPDAGAQDVFPFGVQLHGSAAVENAGFAVGLGVRYRFNEHWIVGVDGEYNPWFSISAREFRPGAVNVFATGIARFPLKFQRVNLRSTLQLGVSRVLFDLYGVPEGSVGPYIGFNLLGVDIELARSVYLVINPAHIAIPIPQIEGVPFAYPQYRFTLALQFGA
jgi:hypothetical protein